MDVMKRYLFVLLILTITQEVAAQSRRSIHVHAGDDLGEAYSPNGFYRFPQFKKATVYTHTGVGNRELLFNYNIYLRTIQFISKSGDTLDIANPSVIDSVVFDNASFYNTANGFIELAGQADSIRLVKRTELRFHRENVGGYGTSSASSSIATLQDISRFTVRYGLRLNYDIVIEETVHWFWLSKDNVMEKATKANLLRLLPASGQQATEDFIKKKKIDLDKEKDLDELMAMLQGR
jgi:hypothetical protein